MKKIFLILGKSSAGKDTITTEVIKELELPMALSFTTRPLRAGEVQGKEYDFITLEEFEEIKSEGRLAEKTSYVVAGGDIWYYGLTRNELEKGDYVIAIVNPDGAKQIKRLYGDRVVTIEIKADRIDRLKRYIKRGGASCIGECFRRYIQDNKDFENLKAKYEVYNDSLAISIEKVKRIIRIEMANQLLKETQEEFERNPSKFINGGNE